MPTPVSFSLSQRVLHWLAAGLVFFNLLLPAGMEEWNRSVKRTGSATTDQVASANIHAYVGMAILLLVIFRLALRATRGVPASPPQEPTYFSLVAKATHMLLYIILVAMPLTGMAAYYFGYGTAGDIHADILKVVFWALIAGHVVGALAHQFYWKTNVVRRMTSGLLLFSYLIWQTYGWNPGQRSGVQTQHRGSAQNAHLDA